MSVYFSIRQIRQANEDAGYHFFEPSTMRFFDSRVASKQVYPKATGGSYFITSERFDWNSPRLYTIRECSENGHISTIGGFQAYSTVEAAEHAAERLAGKNRGPCPECGH